MNEDYSRFGESLRRFRKEAGMNLALLAAKAGCSESMLSKIENGKGNPSLDLLHRIAQALGVSIGHLFAPSAEDSPVMREGLRPLINNMKPSQGVVLEALMRRQHPHGLQAHIHIVAPGGGSKPISHEGEEVGYVLEGELDLEINGETFSLKNGDSFYFDSQKPHRYKNTGSDLAKIIWVNTPPTF